MSEEKGPVPPAGESIVSIKGVSKSFDGKEFILKDLDLEIPKGKITVIIGYSGTGKSVLLKHILGLLMPSEGSVTVMGKDLTKMSAGELAKLRQHYGMLFQYAALFDDMTVQENVEFPIKEHKPQTPVAEREKIAREKLKESGLEEKHYKKLPSELSGGMRKRAGLARALALNPDILIYDEPTTGLDPVLTEMVDNLIVDAHNSHKGTTSVVVSHDLYAALRIGDYLAMLDSGKVVLFGTPDDFMKTDIPLVKKFIDKGIHKGSEKEPRKEPGKESKTNDQPEGGTKK